MSEKLKPCPFCGGPAETSRGLHNYDMWGIWCPQCKIAVSALYSNEQDAIDAWNRRAERTCGEWRGDPSPNAISDSAAHEGDELWCEHCDIELDEDWAYCPNCGARVVDE